MLPAQLPEAAHEVALAELHVSVEAPPLATEVGLAESVVVEVGSTVTVAVVTGLGPDAPVQVNKYEAVAVSVPVL